MNKSIFRHSTLVALCIHREMVICLNPYWHGSKNILEAHRSKKPLSAATQTCPSTGTACERCVGFSKFALSKSERMKESNNA